LAPYRRMNPFLNFRVKHVRCSNVKPRAGNSTQVRLVASPRQCSSLRAVEFLNPRQRLIDEDMSDCDSAIEPAVAKVHTINSENSECITQDAADLLPNCFTVSNRRIYDLLHVVGCTCIQVMNS
jgi:hypothetical protein